MSQDISSTQQVDQPQPKFNLTDLEHTVGRCYDLVLNFTKHLPVQNDNLVEVNRRLQELLSIVNKHKTDLQPIDIENKVYEQMVVDKLQTEKPVFSVCGVQLWEQGKLAGTSLYSTVVKARTIRDICNKEYARLGVNHEAKIVNYPVF